jgi:hypothetical protein
MLNWGLRDYWVGVFVDGQKHMLVIQALNENEAEQEALSQFEETGQIYFCELAKGWS